MTSTQLSLRKGSARPKPISCDSNSCLSRSDALTGDMLILDNEGWQLYVKADSSRKNLLRGLDRYWEYVSGIGRGFGKSPLCGPEAAKVLPLESSMQTINRREAVGALSVFALIGKIAEAQTSAGAGPVPFQIIKFDSLAVAHNHTNCQGRSKTRPVRRSKSRPVDSLEGTGYAGSVASGAQRKTPYSPRRMSPG